MMDDYVIVFACVCTLIMTVCTIALTLFFKFVQELEEDIKREGEE